MKFKFFALVLLTVLFLSCTNKKGEGLSIKYIAQSGVLIESGDKKVLIDALFREDPRWDYPSPSESQLDSMIKSISPYNNIDLYLVTHSHVDHIYIEAIEEGLKHNPDILLITTPTVKELMAKFRSDYSQISDRIIAPIIDYGESLDTTIKDIPIHISHLKHMYDLQWADVVYSFLIEMDEKKILHNAGSVGYFKEEYEKIRYDSIGVDVAILYHNFLSDNNTSNKMVIDEYIRPQHIFLSHSNFKNFEFMDSLKQSHLDQYKNLDIMFNKGETWQLANGQMVKIK